MAINTSFKSFTGEKTQEPDLLTQTDDLTAAAQNQPTCSWSKLHSLSEMWHLPPNHACKSAALHNEGGQHRQMYTFPKKHK